MKSFYSSFNCNEVFVYFKKFIIEFFNEKKHLFPNNEETVHTRMFKYLILENNIISTWEQKVGNYLYFCLDGGIGGNLFNIEFLIRIMIQSKKLHKELSEVLFSILIYKFEQETHDNFLDDIYKIRKNEYYHTLSY